MGTDFEIRQVWAKNLDYEIKLMELYLPGYPIVSFDTEFPGTITNLAHLNIPKTSYSKLCPFLTYDLMRSNVMFLDMIQLGLSLSDNHGNSCKFVWEFNFSDFDIELSNQNKDSIDMLKRQGIDFKKNREFGIRSFDFGQRVLRSGLFTTGYLVTWVTFHGAYDFGFLVKVLSGSDLPLTLTEFLGCVRYYFGHNVFDLKHIVVRYCCDNGLFGGLERVAGALGVERVAGRSHQAGSDSLLTMQTFFKVLTWRKLSSRLSEMKGVIHGLELERGEFGLANQSPALIYQISSSGIHVHS